jgi:hypothetical protein
MALTLDVNVSLLNECFELGPFHGLCKPHEDDVLQPIKYKLDDEDDDIVIFSSKENTLNSNDQLNSQVNMEQNVNSPQIKTKLSVAGIIES